jgi:membrane protein
MKIISKIQSFYKNTQCFEDFKSEKGKFFKFYKKISIVHKSIAKFIEKIDSHNIFMLSSGIAFNIFLYFIPLILIAIYLAVSFINFSQVDSTIENLMIELLPDTENTHIMIYEVLTEITTIRQGSSTTGIIGFISLLWLSSLFISALRSGLDRVFEIKGRKAFIFYKLKDIVLTLSFPILIILYSVAIPLLTYFLDFFSGIISLEQKKSLIELALNIFSFLFTFFLFFLIYRFIPSERQSSRTSLKAALFGGGFILIARWVFSWYLETMSNYGAFYGTYAAIISIAIWVYYFAFILLFSAELSLLFEKNQIKKLKKLAD